jgi:hypothetical protein
MLRLIGRWGGRVLSWIGESLFRHADWNVGIVRAPIAKFLEPEFRPQVEWLEGLRRGEFIADPFGIVRHGQLTILCERYDFRVGLGDIVSRGPGTGSMDAAAEIGLAVHRSYPYLLEHAGQLYCIPETHQAREIALYRAEDFPRQWTKVATLVRDVAAADSSVFQYEGRWWLWCVDSGRRTQAELLIWYALDLFGPWIQHRGNPVKIDARSARPAGTPFVHGGSLYRPAQDCSRIYGGRVVINRITCLTPTTFAEEPVAVVEPDPNGPYPDGLHTLSAVGDITLVDGKRIIFQWDEFRRAAVQLFSWAIGGRLTRKR